MLVVCAEGMESLHGFAGGARAVADVLVFNIIIKNSPRREMRGHSGRRDGDRAKQKSSGIPALRESNRGWAYERPRGYPASQETTETPARRRRRSDPRARTAATAAPPSGDVKSVNAAEAEQGCQEGIRLVGGGNVRLGEETFRLTVGGKALEARSGRTQVRRREGVRRADRAHHWSVVVPGCEEMGGRGISCPRPLPPSPQTTNTAILFLSRR